MQSAPQGEVYGIRLCRRVEVWQATRPGGITNVLTATKETRLSAGDHIFISYRRDDARGASGRLYDRLRIVYRDVDSTGTGKWRETIAAKLARSAACVAVIGPRWVEPDHLKRLQA